MYSRNNPKLLVSKARYLAAVEEQGEAWARRYLIAATPKETQKEGENA